MTKQYLHLDQIFYAISDPTRRTVLEKLSRSPASVSELAKSFDMALPSFLQHLRILEKAGLIQTAKKGRVRTCSIQPQHLDLAETWITGQRRIWEQRLNQLDRFLLTDE